MILISDSKSGWYVDGLDAIVGVVFADGRRLSISDQPGDFFECTGEVPPVLTHKHRVGQRTSGQQGALDQYEVKHRHKIDNTAMLLNLDEWQKHGHKSFDDLVMWQYENESLLGPNHMLPRNLRRG
jgi:hypothetical protein